MAAHVETLRASPALRSLPEPALEELAAKAHEVRYETGNHMVPLVDPPPNLGLILEGLGKLIGVNAEGEERIVYVYHPGEIYGEQLLIEDSGIEGYEVLALQPVRAVAFRIHDLLEVGHRHPAILVGVTRALSHRIDSMNDRLMACMSEDARIRLSQLLFDMAEDAGAPSSRFVGLRHPLTHETMGQIIGASRPHITTLLRALEEEGAVKRQGQHGLLVRPSRLGEILARRRYDLLREHEDDEEWNWPRPLRPSRD